MKKSKYPPKPKSKTKKYVLVMTSQCQKCKSFKTVMVFKWVGYKKYKS